MGFHCIRKRIVNKIPFSLTNPIGSATMYNNHVRRRWSKTMDGDSSTDGDNCTCMCNVNRSYIICEYLCSCMPPYAIFRRACFARN